MLHAALPSLGNVAGKILDDLAHRRGQIGCADLYAQRFGLRNRHRLGRLLAREGLPQIAELTAWIRTIAWVAQWESTRLSMYRQALQAQKEPGTYYRTVQRATGMRWRDVRALGLNYVILKFVERCNARSADQREADTRATA